MIVLKNVTKRFGKNIVLSDISFQIAPEEFLCITGPSGAGKSTLIHLLTGAENITEGHIEIDGIDLRVVPFPIMQIYRRRVGVVFQDYKLLNNHTVWENIAFPLEVCGVPKKQVKKRVTELMEQMQLSNRAQAYPRSISGGEEARVAIARAIVHKPMIVMADEPTGNIDPVQSQMIMDLLKNINEDGTTVILATHDTTLVDSLQTRVISIEKGKLVRDSFGGYNQEKGKGSKLSVGVHKVFSGVENKVPKPKKRKKDDSGNVHITATGS